MLNGHRNVSIYKAQFSYKNPDFYILLKQIFEQLNMGQTYYVLLIWCCTLLNVFPPWLV